MRDLFSPWQCAACASRVESGEAFCAPCGARIDDETGEIVRVRLRQADGLRPFTVHCAGLYRGAWARTVRAYKTDPGLRSGPEIERRLGRSAPVGRWIVAPVPMAGVRRRERGVNPAERLARAVARGLDGEYRPRLLRRVRFRRTSRGLSAAERAREVTGAFALGPDFARSGLPRPPGGASSEPPATAPSAGSPAFPGPTAFPVGPGASPIRGVLLVDDVLTTGATLLACARVLEAAGWPCQGLVLAWTPPRGKPPRQGARFRYRVRRGSFAASVCLRDVASKPRDGGTINSTHEAGACSRKSSSTPTRPRHELPCSKTPNS